MHSLRKSAIVSLALGVTSLLAMGASHLALTDIWHGEGDLRLEWSILRGAFLVLLAFHFAAFETIRRVLRSNA
ncbi:MAG TPA: hypothetical protein VLK65_05230, partial [Vicinamibacteria bacterium]|nr:hypothetical protein [Vicinamibacteria bacterium]